MKGVGGEGLRSCHGRGAAVSGSRRWASFVGRLSPVREWRFLFFCHRGLALGGMVGVITVSFHGGGPGAMVVSGVW